MTTSPNASATSSAILSASRYTQLSTVLVAADGLTLTPDPWALPAPSDLGFELGDTIGADVSISFHRDLRGRTVWLVIDPDNAPLSGDYVCEVDGTVVTYTAASDADVDTVLQGWADAINADATVGDIVTAAKVKLRDPSAGAYDAVRIVRLPSAAVAATGIPAGAAYKTFSLGASTSAPAGAALEVHREVDSASMAVYTLPGFSKTAAVAGALNGSVGGQVSNWRLHEDHGSQPALGFDDRFNFAARAAARVVLYSPVTSDEAFTIVSSGAGIYTVRNVATVAIAPSQESA